MKEEMNAEFTRIWLENRDKITERCNFKLQSCPSEAEDVVADISLYLYVAISEGKIHSNPVAWLNAVTENCIKKKYTEMNKKKNLLVEYNEENVDCVEDYTDAEDLFIDSLISENSIDYLSVQVIRELKDKERELYKSLYIKGMRMQEIADELGITVTAVRERSCRLTKKLKLLAKSYAQSAVG